jgi:hypothetical protein
MHGVISGCDLTSKDLKVAWQLFGPCEDTFFGKVTAPISSSHGALVETVVRRRLHCDLMFLRGSEIDWTFLIAVEDATGLITCTMLKNKTMVTITEAFKSLVGWFKSHGHVVAEIVTDSEANFVGIERAMEATWINMRYHIPKDIIPQRLTVREQSERSV